MEIKEGAKLKGKFEIEIRDENGNLISKSECHNILTTEGLNSLLNIMLHAATQIATWYCVMFEGNTTPAAGDTYAVPNWTEYQTYDETVRPAYVEAESTAKSTTNSANKAVFTANATKTLYGAALVGGGSAPATKANTAGGGTLLCIGTFGTAQPVIATNVVNLTYTVTSADDGA